MIDSSFFSSAYRREHQPLLQLRHRMFVHSYSANVRVAQGHEHVFAHV